MNNTFSRSKSLAETLSDLNLPMELGYQYLEYDNIDLTTVNFAYRYNSKSGKFEVVNDGSKYTISELSWAIVEDNANLYEFHLVDVM